jgi:hypothetical protein
MSYSILLLIIHINSGCIALLSGLAVMVLGQSSRQQAYWRTWFFTSMLVMASTAIPLALLRADQLSAFAGVLTLYLLARLWSAAKRVDGKPGKLECAAAPLALGCVSIGVWWG